MNKGKLKSISLAFPLEQKIDGMCLKEGLSDSELSACEVRTVGDQKLLKRKIADLVGKSPLRLQKVKFALPKISLSCCVGHLCSEERFFRCMVNRVSFQILLDHSFLNSLSKSISFHKK